MYNKVINFWFDTLSPKQWWIKDPQLDQQIKDDYLSLHQQAYQGELYTWRTDPEGRLAEIIILDQFSRNIYRDTPQAFTQDPLALALAQEAVRLKVDQELNTTQRSFMYLPFMHSESALIHQQAEKLFTQPGLEQSLDFELKHKIIIDRFGRYPHRNKILGRTSTQEELEFLNGPDSSF